MQPNPNPAPLKPWTGYAALLGLALLFGGLSFDVLHQVSRGKDGAQMTYYLAASALRQGVDPYTGGHNSYPYIYPPLYAFCFQPLTHLSAPASARVMTGINGLIILAALLLCTRAMLRRLHVDSAWATVFPVAAVAAIIVIVPIHNEWRGLETNSVVLLSFALALYWLDRRPILAGLTLAFAINIKYLPIIAVPYFLLRRRWLAAFATLAGSVALSLLPATSLGWSTNLHYLHEAVSGLGHLTGAQASAGNAQVNTTGDLSSLSISSAVARIATASGWSKPIELAMVGAIAVAWAGAMWLAYRRGRLPVLNWPAASKQQTPPFDILIAVEWAALITFALAFSPNTQNRNLVQAIIPATLAAALLCTAPTLARRALAGMICLLMLIGLVLPIAAMGKPFTVAWLSTGGPCWTLLITFVALVFATLWPYWRPAAIPFPTPLPPTRVSLAAIPRRQ